MEMAVRNGGGGGDVADDGGAGAAHEVGERPSTSSSGGGGGEAQVFREAGTLQRSRSLRPEDRPPEPFVYRSLEEIAEKLGAAPAREPPAHGGAPRSHSPCKGWGVALIPPVFRSHTRRARRREAHLAQHSMQACAQGVQGAGEGCRAV